MPRCKRKSPRTGKAKAQQKDIKTSALLCEDLRRGWPMHQNKTNLIRPKSIKQLWKGWRNPKRTLIYWYLDFKIQKTYGKSLHSVCIMRLLRDVPPYASKYDESFRSLEDPAHLCASLSTYKTFSNLTNYFLLLSFFELHFGLTIFDNTQVQSSIELHDPVSSFDS